MKHHGSSRTNYFFMKNSISIVLLTKGFKSIGQQADTFRGGLK